MTTPDPQAHDEIDAIAEWFRRWMGASSIRKRDRAYAAEILAAVEPLVAARVRAEYEEPMRRLAEYENTITWNTTCIGCAKRLDNLIAERAAGYGEAVAGLRDVHQRTGSPAAKWAADYLASVGPAAGPTDRPGGDRLCRKCAAPLYRCGCGQDARCGDVTCVACTDQPDELPPGMTESKPGIFVISPPDQPEGKPNG